MVSLRVLHQVLLDKTLLQAGYCLTLTLQSIVQPSQNASVSFNLDSHDEDQLNQVLQKFWEIESVPKPLSSDLMSINDLKCEKHYKETFSRDKSGRFTVKLPFISNDTVLLLLVISPLPNNSYSGLKNNFALTPLYVMLIFNS